MSRSINTQKLSKKVIEKFEGLSEADKSAIIELYVDIDYVANEAFYKMMDNLNQKELEEVLYNIVNINKVIYNIDD